MCVYKKKKTVRPLFLTLFSPILSHQFFLQIFFYFSSKHLTSRLCDSFAIVAVWINESLISPGVPYLPHM